MQVTHAELSSLQAAYEQAADTLSCLEGSEEACRGRSLEDLERLVAALDVGAPVLRNARGLRSGGRLDVTDSVSRRHVLKVMGLPAAAGARENLQRLVAALNMPARDLSDACELPAAGSQYHISPRDRDYSRSDRAPHRGSPQRDGGSGLPAGGGAGLRRLPGGAAGHLPQLRSSRGLQVCVPV